MDPNLRKVTVSSMAEVDEAFIANREELETIQLHVYERTSLIDAVQINRRMLAGIRANDALQIFNPELVARKAEAEEAVRAALESIDLKIFHAEKEVAATREEVVALQIKLARGPDVIRVGPSLRRRAVDREQVLFPSNMYMPEEGIAPRRKLGLTARRNSRGLDADSQTAFWDLNLKALKQKDLLQTAYLHGLLQLREDISREALEEQTDIGSGYTDFTFQF